MCHILYLHLVGGREEHRGHQGARGRPGARPERRHQAVPVSQEGPHGPQLVYPHEPAGGEGNVQRGHSLRERRGGRFAELCRKAIKVNLNVIHNGSYQLSHIDVLIRG